MSEKLTAAWLEQRACEMDASDGNPHPSADICECHADARTDAAVYRFAARALRAREWCERNHDTVAAAIVYAILTGGEP